MREVGQRGDVHGDHIELMLPIEFVKRAVIAEAGIIDQDIHIELLLCTKLVDKSGGFILGKICGEDDRVDPERGAEFVRQGAQRCLLPWVR